MDTTLDSEAIARAEKELADAVGVLVVAGSQVEDWLHDVAEDPSCELPLEPPLLMRPSANAAVETIYLLISGTLSLWTVRHLAIRRPGANNPTYPTMQCGCAPATIIKIMQLFYHCLDLLGSPLIRAIIFCPLYFCLHAFTTSQAALRWRIYCTCSYS